jgi:hypothetical protein
VDLRGIMGSGRLMVELYVIAVCAELHFWAAAQPKRTTTLEVLNETTIIL